MTPSVNSPSRISLICAVIVILIIGSLTLFAYMSETSARQEVIKLGLKSTAGVMATQFSPADLAGIRPGSENSIEYRAVVQKLRTLRSMDDHILNAYILHVSPDGTVTFLVDDLYPDDPQGSAKTGEVSTAPRNDILLTLSGPATSDAPYTTKYGSFMTAYAPIDDSPAGSTGNTTAVLAIDVAAQDYLQSSAGSWIILLTGLVSLVLVVSMIFVSGAGSGEGKRD